MYPFCRVGFAHRTSCCRWAEPTLRGQTSTRLSPYHIREEGIGSFQGLVVYYQCGTARAPGGGGRDQRVASGIAGSLPPNTQTGRISAHASTPGPIYGCIVKSLPRTVSSDSAMPDFSIPMSPSGPVHESPGGGAP